jgi:arginase family enzyme
METVYLHSGTEDAIQIVGMLREAGYLKGNIEVYDMNQEDTNLTGKKAILICGHGYEHHKSLEFSKELVADNPDIDIDKVLFDAHIDFHSSYDNENLHATHNYPLLMSGICSEIYVNGIVPYHGNNKMWKRRNWKKTKKSKIEFRKGTWSTRKLKGRNLHISTDLDVLWDCDYVHRRHRIGRTLYTDLMRSLNRLNNNNLVFGVDVVGLDIRSDMKDVKIGIKHYGEIIKMFA